MPQFSYIARDRTGKKRTGILQAQSKHEVHMKMRERGMRVLEVEQKKETIWTKEIHIGAPVPLKVFVIYLRQLATLLRAGITVVDATRILAQQTESKALKKALNEVEEELREGNHLSAAYSKHPKIFTNMFINMVRAGEVSGTLDSTLERMADYYEKQYRTRQKVKSALTYPIAVGIISLVVVVFLLMYTVPMYVDMFNQFDGELPTITVFVLVASEWMLSYWWLMGLGIGLLFTSIYVVSREQRSKYYLHYALLKMPIFGGLLQKSALARTTRTLSSLFSSAVPILQAVTIVEAVVGNEVIARVLRESRHSLEQGKSLTEPMNEHWVFPPLVTQMIVIGEQTGSLDHMLMKVADFYEAEVDTATDQMKALIEPLMIVFLASIVGTIVLSIIAPMFEIFNAIK
ncbi:type II secretion system F family protein [Priestia taiwanensis]|uniref:Type II secretion system protein F n=1 Tax=Priestia taiwanensis TaxID=1347902 RepID=A0A917ER59_9BACI|nr:type II secretion system F family protein [Priestia taiwanensis]MBM7363595.1 type IV pilus assembly protein PilC [Priestia taiwanensis]GGE75782.1 type II secretion system protein F [Priestia taiwanensis]